MLLARAGRFSLALHRALWLENGLSAQAAGNACRSRRIQSAARGQVAGGNFGGTDNLFSEDAVRPVDVVVLSRYPDIFEGFRESIDKDFQDGFKFVIWDYRVENRPGPINGGWASITTAAPFSMARNANIGWKVQEDILYCGDDVRFIEPDTVKRLQEVAYSDYSIGIVSPLHGWHKVESQSQFVDAVFVPFVCVYIKRSLIDQIGYLDESFEGYGIEDCDWCLRARKAGAKIGWAPQIKVQHGEGKFDYGTTFKREFSEKQMQEQDEINRLKLCAKWNLPTGKQEMWEAIKNV